MDETVDLEGTIADLRRRLEELRYAVRLRWQRDLPISELLSDRWARARALGFGAGASIYDSSYVYGDVAVGEQTWIGPNTILDGDGGLTIGRYCSIASGVQIYTHDTVQWALTAGAARPERASVHIGDCCHVGAQTVVLKGVTIGHHSVVGACALVNADVEPYSVVVGAPCRKIGWVEIDASGAARIVIDQAGSKGRPA